MDEQAEPTPQAQENSDIAPVPTPSPSHSKSPSSIPSQLISNDHVSNHVRNNESFSRSRSSTGALLDTNNVLASTDDNWPSGIHADSIARDATDDFNAAFDTDSRSINFEADLVEHDRKEATEDLQAWADENVRKPQPAITTHEARPNHEESLARGVSDETQSLNLQVEAAYNLQSEAEAALQESSVLGNASTGTHEAGESHDTISNSISNSRVEDMFGLAGDEDDWSKAIDPAGEQEAQNIEYPMASNIIQEPEPETTQELRQPLMNTENVDPIPALAEDADFGEALKSVNDDLNEAQEANNSASAMFGDSQHGDDDWLKPSNESVQDLDDSWTKAMGESEVKQAENSWEAAFADGFDDDGFLDEDGILEEEVSGQQESTMQPVSSKTSTYTPSQVNAYAPLPSQSQPSTPHQNTSVSPFAPAPPVQTSRSSQGQSLGMKFFEDLPVAQPIRARKPKQQVVQPPGTTPPPSIAPPQPTTQPVPPPPPPPQQSSTAPAQDSYPQLQQPQRLDLFPPQPTQSPDAVAYTHQAAPQQQSLQPQALPTSRYSPAPASSTSPSNRYASAPSPGPPASSRYSSAPPQPKVPPKDTFSYTSQQSQRSTSQEALNPPTAPQRQPSSRYSPVPSQSGGVSSPSTTSPPSSNYSPVDNVGGPGAPGPPPSLATHKFAPRTSSPLAQPDARPQVDRSVTAPAPSPAQIPQEAGLTKLPPAPIQGGPPTGPPRAQAPKFEAPRRPRTQSPERQAANLRSPEMPADRRASLQETPKAPSSTVPVTNTQAAAPSRPSGPSIPDDVEFLLPSDPLLAEDPLQRWKGCPTVQWSSGSLMATHFPRRDLRFGGGRSAPACKCSPGEIKVGKIKEQMPLDQSLATFPGPLKSKSRKKDLLSWFSNRIDELEREVWTQTVGSMSSRASERILLWKIMRVFTEQDGTLSGNSTIDMAVKQILVPPIEDPVSGGHSRSTSSVTAIGQADGSNPFAVAEIRRLLMSGDREKAVWYAVDNRLWGHAMLISSAAEGTLWKQVAQEFVRSEVRSSSSDRKSLSALYSIMAQNWDESVDELVPASARAGFQMMSTADAGGQSQTGLEGLNKWQETLSLVVGNRSPQDEFGLAALAKLLKHYGRIEASHICSLFAPSLVRLGGLDDPDAHITLLGADVANSGGNDIDAILLTEVYEFGLSLRPSTGSCYIPHLQAYKLHHAQMLADGGYRTEASQYCDSITTAIKSMTRPSPYYHPALLGRLEDLTQRLSQTPKEGSSWISKPTVGKVSGSMWAKFNSFVAGDDDAASNGSGAQPDNDAGPFARLPEGTPTISRNTSHADLSSFTPMNATPMVPTGNSRYAPSHSGSPEVAKASPPAGNSYQPAVPNSAPRDIPKPAQSYTSPPSRSDSFGPPPSGPSYNLYQPGNHLGISDAVSQASSSYDPPILQHPGLSGEHAFGSPSTTFSDRGTSSHGIPHEDMPAIEEEVGPQYENGLDSGANGFEATGGYAPPTGDTGYVPYEPEPESPESKPKKKNFMDDGDDDLVNRAAALKGNGAPRTREPSEEVRKAAEADAERDRQAKEQRKSSGWFGGWFGGKKDPNAPVVHKAKLGEENSFYYDPEQKRWINKKAPETSQPASSTPPPPRAKPAPTSTLASGVGLAPPSRSATPARSDASGGSGEGHGGSMAPPSGPGTGPPSNPPSRPPTSLSNASSIDDMLAPGPRRGGGAKRGKKRQVVDVMSK